LAQFVGGRYQLIAQLGGGGMADVYLAKLTGKADFAKLAVVKRLKPIEDEDAEIVRMFADEARLCARLNHPNIVQTFEVGEDTSGPFLVMEYIEGQPLGRIRSRAGRREKTIPRGVALKVLCDTIDALAYAHALADHDGTPLKVVHRDVSPENIMVTYSGNTKLVDFGVAKTSASASVTRAGVLKGKVAYMAPEQARSDTNIDGRADVFAAGLVLWELLTAQRMWEGMSEAKVFERLLDKDPLPKASTIDSSIPEDFDEICAKAMAKDKEERYASASDLLDALEKACGKHNLRASDREIGQFVAGLFENERDKVKGLVSGSVAKPKDGSKSTTSASEPVGSPLPQVSRTPSLDATLDGGPIPPPEESDPLVWRALSSGSLSNPISSPSLLSSSDGSSMPAETAAGTAETRHAAPTKKDGPMRFVIGGLAVAGLVAVAVVVGTRLNPQPQPDKTTPVVVATPPPSQTPAAVAPVDVSIDIAVKPTTAKIYIDGKLAPSNPHRIKIARADASHEIRAEADGYESRSMVVAFDRDRALDMVLVKNTAPTTTLAVNIPQPTRPSHATTTHSATTATPSATTSPPPSTSKGAGITEIDPSKPKTGPSKQPDKIDTDVFKR
jgi:serine/threonine protein kinase